LQKPATFYGGLHNNHGSQHQRHNLNPRLQRRCEQLALLSDGLQAEFRDGGIDASLQHRQIGLWDGRIARGQKRLRFSGDERIELVDQPRDGRLGIGAELLLGAIAVDSAVVKADLRSCVGSWMVIVSSFGFQVSREEFLVLQPWRMSLASSFGRETEFAFLFS